MASIDMPSFAEMLDAFNRANRLDAELRETRRQLANVQSHYSRLKSMYATLKGETKKRTKMQTMIINAYESGVTDYHVIVERVGCTYGYAKNVLSHYKQAVKNDRQ